MALAKKNIRRSKRTDELIAKGDFEGIGAALTYRQRRWCEEFIIDYDATKAAHRAGYTAKHMDRQAYQLMNHPGCKAYVEYLDQKKRKEVEGTVLDKEYVIKKTLEGINKANDNNNLSAYFRGLELLARHFGMFIDKTEISGPDGEAIQIEQKTKEEAENFIKALEQLSKKKTVELI